MVRGQFQRHRARGGNRHIGSRESRTFQRGVRNDLRRDRPVVGQACDQFGDVGHGGQGHTSIRIDDFDTPERRTDHRDQTRHFRLARSRQGQDQRARAVHHLAFGISRQRFGYHRMPDKIAGHSCGGHQGRLERQQRQNVVNDLCHFRSAARTPCPDRRRNIMDGFQVRTLLFHQGCDAQAEIGAVDGDQGGGGCCDDRLGGFGDSAFQGCIFRQDFGDAHDRQLGHREPAGHALTFHQRPADALKHHTGRQGFQTCHQRSTQPVARGFPGDEEKLHARDHRNRPSRSASARISDKFKQITEPA